MIKYPLSASDLIAVAKAMKDFERLLIGPNGYRARSEAIGQIEVLRPDDDEVIGHFVQIDEWLGFVPLGSSDE